MHYTHELRNFGMSIKAGMAPYRVLLLSPSFEDKGGVASFCRLLMKNVSQDYQIDHLEIGNRPENRSPVRRVSFFARDALKLGCSLRKHGYDLVHINPSLEILSLVRDSFYLFLVSRVFRMRSLVVFHGWNQKIAKHITSNCLLRTLFRSLYRRASLILVLCRPYKEQFELMGLSPALVDVITTMYQVEETGSGEIKKDPSAPVQILFMARLLRSKGVYIAADVGRLLVENGIRNFRLVFAGDGPELDGIRRYRDKHGLKEYFLAPGYLKGDEKRTVLENSDIFLYPTYYGEGCPIVILEAMGAGLAIVSTPVAAIPEIVEHNVNGFIVDSMDERVFYPFIFQLIQDRGLLNRMRETNKGKAEANYEAGVVTKKIESFYMSISNNKQHTG